MKRLLMADFARLRGNTFLWIIFASAVFMGIFSPIFGHRTCVIYMAPDSSYSMDYWLLKFTNVLAFSAALFCSLYTGTDYSEGTLRNKIAVGHSRRSVYVSNLIVNVVAISVAYSIYLLVALCVGLPFLGTFRQLAGKEILVLVICAYAAMAAFAAVFTLIIMINSNPITALGINLCIVIVSLCFAIHQLNLLTDVMFWTDAMATRREMTLFLLDFLPGSQIMDFYALKDGFGNFDPGVMLGGSVFFIVASTAVGLKVFCRKDLN